MAWMLYGSVGCRKKSLLPPDSIVVVSIVRRWREELEPGVYVADGLTDGAELVHDVRHDVVLPEVMHEEEHEEDLVQLGLVAWSARVLRPVELALPPEPLPLVALVEPVDELGAGLLGVHFSNWRRQLRPCWSGHVGERVTALGCSSAIGGVWRAFDGVAGHGLFRRRSNYKACFQSRIIIPD